jgi:tRNA_anti-like
MPRDPDDEDDRPRRRRDDEDDRPSKSRRRAVDDEDQDDRPSKARRRPVEDDDDDRPRKRRRVPDDDYDDRPRRRKKKKPPQHGVLGILALVTGFLGLGMSFACGAIGLVPAVIGLGLGIVGWVTAQKSRGRQSPVLPISGSAVSLVATVVSVIFLVSFIRHAKQFKKDFEEGMEQVAKDQAERAAELAKAPKEVEAAGAAGTAVRVTAVEFYNAWEDPDRADKSYKNKVIEVTGVFNEVNFGLGDAYRVMLKGGPGQFDIVSCQFAKNQDTRAKLAQLQPGQTVTIRGKCLGDGAVLEACVLVQ